MRGERLRWSLLALSVGILTYWGTFVAHRPERYHLTFKGEPDGGCLLFTNRERAEFPFGWEPAGEGGYRHPCGGYFQDEYLFIRCECPLQGKPDGGLGH